MQALLCPALIPVQLLLLNPAFSSLNRSPRKSPSKVMAVTRAMSKAEPAEGDGPSEMLSRAEASGTGELELQTRNEAEGSCLASRLLR